MEREQGFQFVKRDITIKDSSNRNTVVVRLAALDQATLDSYLKVYKLGLKIISVPDINGVSKAINESISMEKNDKSDINAKDFSSVYVEEIYRSLESNKTKYAINFEVNDKLDNARWSDPYKPGAYGTILISSDFPEELWITKTSYLPNAGWALFEFKLELKSGSIFSSYYDPCCLHMVTPSFTTIPDNFWSSDFMTPYQQYNFDIDGPKKARVTVRSIHLSTFSVGFLNW